MKIRTSIHWHGIWQRNTNPFDGVPGVTQCPIAPGQTFTYRFRATQYGTSWYHSHFSLQLADGLYGPVVIHGPATAEYDVDLGPVFLTDWYRKSAFILWEEHTRYGGFPVRENAVAPTGLFNGSNVFGCGEHNCVGDGDGDVKRSVTSVQKGKKYRIRLIDSSVDGWMKFTIDGHKLTVIAADFVPIEPYETDAVILTSGQRYDVVVEADQDVGNYWMRVVYQTACNGLTIDNDDIRGILRYEGADIADPTTSQWKISNSCGDEPYDKLVPYVKKTVGNAAAQKNLNVGWKYDLPELFFHWTLNSKDLTIDWSSPTDYLAYKNESVFPTESNVYEVPNKNQVRLPRLQGNVLTV